MDVITAEPLVRTDRIVLRAPTASDAPAIAHLANDFDVARMTTRMPFPYGLSDAETWLGRLETRDPRREMTFAMEEDGKLAGVLGLHPAEDGIELGYWLGRPYWGRGLATEAARGVLDWVRRHWAARFLRAGHFADNPASGAVLVKAGFLYTGEVQARSSTARGEAVPTRMMVWLA